MSFLSTPVKPHKDTASPCGLDEFRGAALLLVCGHHPQGYPPVTTEWGYFNCALRRNGGACMSQETHDKIYTADEAADRFRLPNRSAIKLARKHGYCSRFGRDYLFSEADLLALWQALREPAEEPRRVVVPASSDYQQSLLGLTRRSKKKGKADV